MAWVKLSWHLCTGRPALRNLAGMCLSRKSKSSLICVSCAVRKPPRPGQLDTSHNDILALIVQVRVPEKRFVVIPH